MSSEREKAYEQWRADKQWENAKRVASRTGHKPEDVLVNKELSERYRRELDEERQARSKPVYGPEGQHSFWADFIADALATSQEQKGLGHGHSQVFGPPAAEARKRLESCGRSNTAMSPQATPARERSAVPAIWESVSTPLPGLRQR
jgi:hypothetical protein